jgi:hypothetical protein
MPRILRLFGRRLSGQAVDPPVTDEAGAPLDDTVEAAEPPAESVAPTSEASEAARGEKLPDESAPALTGVADSPADVADFEPMSLHDDAYPVAATPVSSAPTAPRSDVHAEPVAPSDGTDEEWASSPASEPVVEEQPDHVDDRAARVMESGAPTVPESKTLIGGKEKDIVPLIPDTRPDVESYEVDDETVTEAAVEALRAACDLMVSHVNRIRTTQDGSQVIVGMIVLIGELDARYADDWGIVRRNGMEELLNQVRGTITEGDRFILESLENGRGGLTADAFVRDLRTVGESDRRRMVAQYAIFLIVIMRCVLRQYLLPLESNQMQLRDLSHRLDYLIDGVREALVSHISAGIRTC